MSEFINDTFSGTAGQKLEAYNPSWTFYTTTGIVITAAGRIRRTETQTRTYWHSGTPASEDYHVSADFVYVGTANDNPGIAARIQSETTYYFLRFNTSAQNVELYKLVSGTATVIATAAAALAVGQTARFTLEVAGTAIRAYRDGSLIASATDSTITAAGKAGVRLTSTSSPTDSIGVHLDNFVAADGVFGPSDTTLPTLTGAVTFASITQTSYTAQWPAGSDNVAVAGYEYQIGSTAGAWTNAGNNLSAAITGRTAGTTETVYVRAYDAAGNRSTPAISGSVTLASLPAAGINVTEPLKNNTGTVLAGQSGVRVAVLQAADLVSVFETSGLTTNASGVLATISDAAIITGQQYHVAIKLADGGVGITGPITAS